MNAVLMSVFILVVLFTVIGIACKITNSEYINEAMNEKSLGILSMIKLLFFSIINAIAEYVNSLFFNRNIFGKILGILILIISIPSILIVVLVGVILIALLFLKYLYKLGDKK